MTTANKATRTAEAPTLASVLAAVTSEQRGKVRLALEEHFDDATGRYLDGMSDARIAETLKVPRVVVEQLREVAYGPLRDDPEIMAIKAQFADLSGKISALEGQRAILSARLDAVIKTRGA